jgi:signal transduction histidine kinase
LARLATDLGAAPPPGALRSALARTLGDDRLEIAYWLPNARRYVDAGGRPADLDPTETRARTAIERDGRPIAVVVHDRSLRQTHDLEREIGAASRLVIDNERLRAHALAQLADLRESRARIVETADDTRRRLERNLHDGAQQRLLALTYALQRSGAATRAAGDTRRADLYGGATAETTKALEELRELATGIFPSILADSGLGPALASFTDVAPLRVELVGVPDIRFDAAVETASYLTVVEAAADAHDRGAKRVSVTFLLDESRLVVAVTHNGRESDRSALIHIADRLGALGGRLDIDGAAIEAVIPCG